MADKYTSQIALLLDAPVEDVELIVKAAGQAGDIDRGAWVRGGTGEAMEVHWGGSMQKGVVRRLVAEDGTPMLRTEAFVNGDGLEHGMQRQAKLLQALARQLHSSVTGIRDLASMTDQDVAWMHRVAIGHVELVDAIVTKAEGEGTWWVRTHGAARFDVPDLELYGLRASQVDAATEALKHVHGQLLERGLKHAIALPGGEPVYLVPVLDAWPHLNLDFTGVGRGGRERGPGLDGPRATLSILHRPRLGRYRKDFDGVLETL